MQETDIRKIAIPGQPRPKVCETLFQEKKLGIVVCACHPSYCEKHKIGGSESRLVWTKSEILSPNHQSKKGLEV
jgi:hypothetical protein